MTPRHLALSAFFALFSSNAWAATADVVVFDDADRNGFNHNAASCGGGAFIESGIQYSGTAALGVSKQFDNNGGGWGAPVIYSTQSDYDGVTFWFNSGNNPSARTSLAVYDSGGNPHFAHLEDVYGAALPAGTWVHFVIPFSSGYFAQASSTSPDSLQYFCVITHSAASGDSFYVDQVTLTGADIFKNGFDN